MYLSHNVVCMSKSAATLIAYRFDQRQPGIEKSRV
jgi:hypothetical protein